MTKISYLDKTKLKTFYDKLMTKIDSLYMKKELTRGNGILNTSNFSLAETGSLTYCVSGSLCCVSLIDIMLKNKMTNEWTIRLATGLPKAKGGGGIGFVECESPGDTHLYICELELNKDGIIYFGSRGKYTLNANTRINGFIVYEVE